MSPSWCAPNGTVGYLWTLCTISWEISLILSMLVIFAPSQLSRNNKKYKDVLYFSPEEMKQMMDVNVISNSLCTQLSIKLMLKKGIDDGHIIFNSRFVIALSWVFLQRQILTSIITSENWSENLSYENKHSLFWHFNSLFVVKTTKNTSVCCDYWDFLMNFLT